MVNPTALIIEDDPDFRASLAALVKRECYDTSEAASLAEPAPRWRRARPTPAPWTSAARRQRLELLRQEDGTVPSSSWW